MDKDLDTGAKINPLLQPRTHCSVRVLIQIRNMIAKADLSGRREGDAGGIGKHKGCFQGYRTENIKA